jgi:HPt (histidine-containing phosphotransfer) domain-containing protein
LRQKVFHSTARGFEVILRWASDKEGKMKTEAIGRSEGTADERKGQDGQIDLGHLSRYTLGERVLEREILELFCTQAAIYLERLREAPSDRQWQDAAHSLKGSAQGIGAWRTAAAAECAESLSGATLSEPRGARLRELESSVDEAKTYIRSLL